MTTGSKDDSKAADKSSTTRPESPDASKSEPEKIDNPSGKKKDRPAAGKAGQKPMKKKDQKSPHDDGDSAELIEDGGNGFFRSGVWREKIWPVLRTLGIILALLLIIAGSTFAYVLNHLIQGMPEWNPDQLGGDNTSFIYDSTGQVIYNLHGEQNRIDINIDQVPKDLINAFVATEDQSFYSHYGFNVKGILRAVYFNMIGDNPYAQGASTITQQLARIAFLSPEKTWERKGKEIILAIKIERNYSKDEIMQMYLNKIYFGAGAYGIEAAAQTFFGKGASKLTLPESAFLAGLVQSPSYYNPYQNYDAAKTRQRHVLDNMVECGFLSSQQADEAYTTKLNLIQHQASAEDSKYGFYRDAVIDEATQVLAENNLFVDPENAVYRAGLHIYTAMDPNLQSYMETVYAEPSNFPQEYGEAQVESSCTVVENSTGEVKALMGGRAYGALRGFNRATSGRRQPGSTIKPVTVYSPALEQGFTPDYSINDHALMIRIGGETWTPQNVSKSYMGYISMDTAVTYSVNTYAVQLLQKIGIDYSFNFAETLGLTLCEGPGPSDYALAPLSLGGLTKGTTTKEMAGAYATFGNGGVFNKPHLIRKIVDRNGNVIYEYKGGQQVMRADTATSMVGMLQHVVQYGTGTRAQVPGVPTGGKTGTSERYADSWFVGLTPTYSCAVWMGYDVDLHMNQVFGGSYPAAMFRSILTKAHENQGEVYWTLGDPNAVVTRVDPVENTHYAGETIYISNPEKEKPPVDPNAPPVDPNAPNNGTTPDTTNPGTEPGTQPGTDTSPPVDSGPAPDASPPAAPVETTPPANSSTP